MKAWLFQDTKQKQKLGEKCPWSVGWYDPDGKKKSERVGTKSAAQKKLRMIEGQLAAGTYDKSRKITWQDFRKEYTKLVMDGMTVGSREATRIALDHFQRLVKPVKLSAIKTKTIDGYVAKRRTERGAKKDSVVSAATINKELRHLKAVFRKAKKWKYVSEVPDFDMQREELHEPRFVSVEHLQAIYNACDSAKLPSGLPYPPGDWWKALIVFAYMTGWRLNEPLSLTRGEVDLDAGTALLRAENNKGRRGELVPLHPVVLEHLATIKSFEPNIFPWYHNRRALWSEFLRIQQAAGIELPCYGKHVHTPSCHVYGFHDLRRAFATVNAETLSGDELQRLMRHKSYTTTQRYINMAHRLSGAVKQLSVPSVLKTPRAVSNTP